jgi:cytochrome c oxidase subunit 4
VTDTETTPEPEETPAAPGGSTIVDVVKAEVAAHPATFSKDAEGPMLPGEEHEHATPAQYVFIAAVLCVITAIEIGLYYLEGGTYDLAFLGRWRFSNTVIVAILLPLSFIKFIIVAGYFMHLKTDSAMFRRWFVIGGILACIVFTIASVTLGARFSLGTVLGLLGIGLVVAGMYGFSFVSKAKRNV